MTETTALPAGIAPPVVGADDQARAAALVDVARGLDDTFSRSADRLAVTEENLKNLDARNGSWLDFMLGLTGTLEKADIFVAAGQRPVFDADLRYDIAPAIARWREAAVAFAQGPAAQPAALAAFAILYRDFQRQARKLAGNGAGTFAAYGQVMAFEYITGALVAAPKAERLAAFDQYATRWGLLLDQKDRASVAGAALGKKTNRQQMGDLLNAADRILAQDRRFVVEKGHRVSQPCRGGTYGYLQDRIAEVQGNSSTGYRYSESWGDRYGDFNTCQPPADRPGVRCLPDLANPAALLGSVAIDRSWGDVAAKVRFLEEVRTALPTLPVEQELAEKLLIAAQTYAATAKKWRDALQAAP